MNNINDFDSLGIIVSDNEEIIGKLQNSFMDWFSEQESC